ncbi:transposase [Gemmatimonas sp.]|uniref:transposase n=1 Tax=Gemmatimonas sp. TaxID=1962908 RepID=UPI00333F82CB
MPRLPRFIQAGVPVHHVLRGNNRAGIFVDDRDRLLYRDLLLEGVRRFECLVHAYVFMSNHTHLLLTPATRDGVSLLTQWMGRKYVTAFNRRHRRTGTLWEGRFRSSVVGSARYFLACSRYIDQNPVRAGIVRAPDEYPWSSFSRLAFGTPDDLVTEHAEYRNLGRTIGERQRAYFELCTPPVDSALVLDIRRATRRGKPLGPVRVRSPRGQATGRIKARL